MLAVARTIGMVPAGAQPQASARAAAVLALQQLGEFADFNDDGNGDLAVGAPGEDVGATADAGAVNVFYGTAAAPGLPAIASQILVQGNPETGDQFGATLTAKDLDGVGGLSDLVVVVGAPGEDVGATTDAGAANLFDNAAGVLPGVSGPALLQANIEAGDQFGAALDI